MTFNDRYFAFRAVACCAIGVGVFCNFPPNSMVADTSLRGSKLIKPNTFFLPTNETHFTSTVLDDHDQDAVKLDFFVAGFPKCGTTTLLKTFEQHNETVVPPQEECSLDTIFQDDMAYARLTDALKESSLDNPNVKRGIKCPFGLSTPVGIERLETWFPGTKLIFGLRHPVYYFQSFYNYRVLMVHQGKLEGPIPPAEYLIGSNDWKRVSTETARFEQVLKSLGKTDSDQSPPTPFKVFLYTLEQMEDENDDRRAVFRATLGSFLELKHKIEPLPTANRNKFVGESGFKETIDICDTKFDDLRNVLVENGRETQRWIREELLQSPDVTVGNMEHFDEILKQWAMDPCLSDEEQSEEESQSAHESSEYEGIDEEDGEDDDIGREATETESDEVASEDTAAESDDETESEAAETKSEDAEAESDDDTEPDDKETESEDTEPEDTEANQDDDTQSDDEEPESENTEERTFSTEGIESEK